MNGLIQQYCPRACQTAGTKKSRRFPVRLFRARTRCGGPHQAGGALNGDHIFSLRAFLSADFREADGLPFGQSLEALAYNGTEMHEQVGAVGALDEAEAFAFVEPLDGSSLLL